MLHAAARRFLRIRTLFQPRDRLEQRILNEFDIAPQNDGTHKHAVNFQRRPDRQLAHHFPVLAKPTGTNATIPGAPHMYGFELSVKF